MTTIDDKEAARKRIAMLADLRKERLEKVEYAQALLKEQQAVRKTLNQALEGEPKSIPALAAATQLSPHEVLWHITAMKKYGKVVEDGTDNDYYLYRLAKET